MKDSGKIVSAYILSWGGDSTIGIWSWGIGLGLELKYGKHLWHGLSLWHGHTPKHYALHVPGVFLRHGRFPWHDVELQLLAFLCELKSVNGEKY